MAVPKRKKSKSKIRSRKKSHKRPLPKASACSQCGGSKLPHRACPSCGYYKGRQVVTVEAE